MNFFKQEIDETFLKCSNTKNEQLKFYSQFIKKGDIVLMEVNVG